METPTIKWNPAATLTYKPRKEKRNVLSRMRDELSVGPFSILHRSINEHLKVRVWTRSFNHVRGICTGYVVAYDKHFNMAMCDVDEVYRNPRCLLRQKAATSKKRKRIRKRKDKKDGGTSTTVEDCTESTENMCEKFLTGVQIKESPKLFTDENLAPQLDGACDSSSSSETQEELTKQNFLESELDIFSAEEEFHENEESEVNKTETEDEQLPDDDVALQELLNTLNYELNTLNVSSSEHSGGSASENDSDTSERYDVTMGSWTKMKHNKSKYSEHSDSSNEGNVSDSATHKYKKEPIDLREKLLRNRRAREKSGGVDHKEHLKHEFSKRERTTEQTKLKKTNNKQLSDEKNYKYMDHSPGRSKERSGLAPKAPRKSRSKTDYDTRDHRRSRSREKRHRDRPSARVRADSNVSKDRKLRDKSRERVHRSKDGRGNSRNRLDQSHSKERVKSVRMLRSISKEKETNSRLKDENSSGAKSRTHNRSEDVGETNHRKPIRTSKRYLSKTKDSKQDLSEHCDLAFQDVLVRHVNQIFIRGDNVVMIALVQ